MGKIFSFSNLFSSFFLEKNPKITNTQNNMLVEIQLFSKLEII